MQATLTSADFATMKQGQAKWDKRLLTALRRIARNGNGPKAIWYRHALEIDGLISFGPPIEGISEYNCYRLTSLGVETLERLTRP